MKKATTTTSTTAKKSTTGTTTAATKTGTTTAAKPAASTAVKKTTTTTTASKTATSTASKTGSSTNKSATSTKPKSDTKSQPKHGAEKQEEKKIEAKKEEIKQDEQKPVEQKNEEQKVQKEEIVHGNVIITYSHYKSKFPIVNGQITSIVIDDEYCISAVFLGNFKMHLFDKNKQKVEEKTSSDNVTTFSGLVADEIYGLQIQEDDEAEAQRESKAFVAEKKEDKLRGQREEGCSCIYGNPCVDSGVCSDWKNRFEVATKNGWKGFS